MFPRKESLTVEFKSEPPAGLADEKVIEAVVAMSNAEGGILYIGIDDDGTVSGLCSTLNSKWHDPVQISAFIAGHTVPPVLIDAELVTSGEKYVAAVRIPRAESVIATRDGKLLRRRYKIDKTPENLPLFPHEIASRLADLRRLDFSAMMIPQLDSTALSAYERMHLRQIIKKHKGDPQLLELSDEEFDRALMLVGEDSLGKLHPTVCGLLLIGEDEFIERYIFSHGACFQYLRGTDVVFNENSRSSIVSIIESFTGWFSACNVQREYEMGPYRTGISEFSESAFREALVNAFAHRDYTRLGRVIVQINDYEMSVSSPGGFISGITSDNILTASPNGRNTALAHALNRLGLSESTGRGIDRIFEDSIIYGRSWPDYSQSGPDEVKLVLPRSAPDLEFFNFLNGHMVRLGRSFSILALLILSLLRKHEFQSEHQLVEGTHFRQERVHSQLELLTLDKIIDRIEDDADYCYTLHDPDKKVSSEGQLKRRISDCKDKRNKNKEAADTDISALSPRDQETLVLSKVALREIANKTEVVTDTHLPARKAYLRLNSLVAQGDLEAIGEKKGRVYKITSQGLSRLEALRDAKQQE